MAGIAVGINKGHIVTKRIPLAKRSSHTKGRVTVRGEVVRQVMKEVVGFSPYEKRIIELLRIGKDKRALKFAKKRLGTHIRAKRKREEMSEALRSKRG
ncbi:60S ribosomal protein L36 [Chondrus crispus]|uniref:60S ribosomal protein L36 n=1 Tax=Chondrus crispus TaxID=2769 RepID=R7Q7T3_CHOCR|nr:60S ribosomal protein L36 [Chondrus crispus]CDF33510.1 60S ribosomal protein L36 [Chondrus crispus]|eukprot:XP_005713313.1 60S ribosomal protein L36 [Chondrus crispus]